MKKSIFSGFFLAWVVAQAAAAPETYGIDPIHSFMLFKDRFLWVGSIDGCFCGGISGMVSFDPAAPEKSTVKFEVKTDTLDTGSARRNNEIKSPDFLDVKQFPLITFKSKSVQKVNDLQYDATGDLTFHGVTKREGGKPYNCPVKVDEQYCRLAKLKTIPGNYPQPMYRAM
jgi:polyisoprenoid-binding protein YceI